MIEKTSYFQHSMQKTSYFQHSMPRKPGRKTRENQFENFRAYRLEMNLVLKTRHIMAKTFLMYMVMQNNHKWYLSWFIDGGINGILINTE